MWSKAVIFLCAWCLAIPMARAHECEEGTFTIDRAYPEFSSSSFYGMKKLEDVIPKDSDFEVQRQLILTGCDGRRMATVSLRNLAAGRRILDGTQVVAVFADGFVAVPQHLKVAVSGKEAFNITLDFGIYPYPIMYVTTGR